MNPTIQIQLNGTPHQLADGTRVAELIEQLALTPQRVALELNWEILPRAQWTEQLLRDGDKVEIVHFVGGG